MIETLSISYCGGCNAGYERVDFVQQVLEKAERQGIKPRIVSQEEAADMALVLAGCQALCVADREDMGGSAKQRFVIGADSLNAQRMPLEEALEHIVRAMQEPSKS